MGHPDATPANLEERIAEAPWLVMNATIDRLWFLGEPIAVQRRLLQAISAEARFALEFKHVEEILRFAEDPQARGKELSLPFGWKVTCSQEEIIFVTPDLREQKRAEEYEYALAVPGTTYVEELGLTFEVQLVTAPDNAASDQLLDAESVGPLKLRNWRAGDRFWPAHTKAPKKIKELLQERHVPQTERRLWPVVESGDEIVWVRGLPGPAKFRAKPGRAAILITENSYGESSPT
jgi:tRNA(Ile)-lysidine synthase